ncbi:MAG: hypothetical protein AAF847_04320 [Bacteroidota bacterium]
MKKALFLWLFSSICTLATAQIGITAGYTSMEAPDWEFEFQQEFGLNNQLFVSGSRIGINYWLRLKKVRVEFFPSLEYANYGTQIGNDASANQADFDADLIGIFLHTRIYPFDFINDCNCPTFSKQNEAFKKGFFLMLSPGVEAMQIGVRRRVGNEITGQLKAEGKPTFGGGVGFDIGVSDFLTLTPLVNARYTPNVDGDHIINDNVMDDDFSDLFQFFAGINIGLRFTRD